MKALRRSLVTLALVAGIASAFAAQALGVGTTHVSLLAANPDAYGSYTVVVADSRPASKLVLFIDGHQQDRTTVTTRHRATFHYVELEGTGRLSFAEVRTRSHGGHYLAKLGYTRYFQAGDEGVRISATEPTKAAPKEAEPPRPTAPAPTPTPPKPVEPSCLNGTYVNSEGNTICKPEESPTGPPAGATARCRDGTYSFSAHRSGTCSSHGGVAEWLV